MTDHPATCECTSCVDRLIAGEWQRHRERAEDAMFLALTGVSEFRRKIVGFGEQLDQWVARQNRTTEAEPIMQEFLNLVRGTALCEYFLAEALGASTTALEAKRFIKDSLEGGGEDVDMAIAMARQQFEKLRRHLPKKHRKEAI